MASSAHNKTCGVCSVSVVAGRGQAIFTSECSHAFHFPCISTYISNGNRLCPVCSARWNNLPFVPAPVQNRPFQPFPVQNRPLKPLSVQKRPLKHPRINNPYNPRLCPVSEPEPLCFNDDEPLPLPDVNHMPKDSFVDSQKVTIKVIPERWAVAASESVSQFALLVGLKAPSLSDDARRAPVDIVTVLDVSGSMAGPKLSLVKRAVHFVIDNLGVSDRLSIVSFSDFARRMLPLCRMTVSGREKAKRAVDSLMIEGGTNINAGLNKGTQVLEERRHKNPVTSILLLSDGQDCFSLQNSIINRSGYKNMFPASIFPRNTCGYPDMLPASIFPRNEGSKQETIPVHTFGFGSDHDPITMHAIADASGGTFSFIESYETIQDAFAGCIGGLLSVVAQELRLKLRSTSHGVEIKSIPSGRYRNELSKEIKSIPSGGYRNEISNQGSEGQINVGDLYADEEKAFLINITIPVYKNQGERDFERKTPLLDITCSYKDAISKRIVIIEGDLVEIRRPKVPSSKDLAVNLEVDRQRNRLRAADSIKQAQQMAEAGNLSGATKLLAEKRSDIMATAAAQAGDGMTKWLESEMRETGMRMRSASVYQQSGRAYALSGMSSHANQRATTRGQLVAGAALALGGSAAGRGRGSGAAFGGYATPQMGTMVIKSRQSKAGEGKTSK